MIEIRARLAAAFAVAAAVSSATPVRATLIQLIDDAKLVDRSPLVVLGTIESKSTPILEPPATEWTISIEKVLKGFIGEGRIVLRVPGGRAGNGLANYIYGTPPFAPGRRAMLFLAPLADGSYRLADFPQGAFFTSKTARRSYAVRDFSAVTTLSRNGRATAGDASYRDFDRFSDWIEDRASGAPRPKDYLVSPSRTELRTLVSNFTLLEDTGLNLRWTAFDGGGSAIWLSSTPGIPGLSGGGATQFKLAQSIWNNEPTTPIRYLYGGTTTNTNGLIEFDPVNTIVWNDPRNEMPGPFDCGSGGTLAHASPWYDTDSIVVFNGKSYHRIVQGDVIFNDNVQCKNDGTRDFGTFIEYVAAHELGHTLGLGHSSESDDETNPTLRAALMYKNAKSRPTSVALTSDDIAGIQALYRKSSTGGGGGGGGGGTGSVGCPAGTPANTLCLLKGRFRVTGTWTNQFNNTNGTAIPISNTDLSGFFYFSDKSNVELIVKILDFGTEIKVFYSQLTNLHFNLSVTDSTTGRTKTYTNTPGDCGAIDGNFAAALTAGPDAEGLQSAPEAATASCTATPNTLCLLNRRFAVDVSWRNQFNNTSGVGKQKTLSNLTGAFAFDDPANLEILIKTLDFGDHILVIYGSLSNFEYTIRVTDTTTGAVKTYNNAAGQFCGGLDQNAF